MTLVDMAASEPHLWDHLHPVWQALPSERRGTFWLSDHPAMRPLLNRTEGRAEPRTAPKHGPPVVVAQWGDAQHMRRHRWLALMEHGAGATYPDPNPAFAGGTDRETVDLFLAPNRHAHDANRHAYPHTANVVVGTPWLDQFHRAPRNSAKTVGFSWHWDMNRWPGGRSALDHHRAGLRDAVRELRDDGWEVIGTAHPKAWTRAPDARTAYTEAGIPEVVDLAEVIGAVSVLCCDVSSAAWWAAATGVAQVVLDAPWYEQAYAQQVWPRFVLPFGYHAAEPRVIPEQVTLAYEQWRGREDFARSVREVVPFRDGRCAERAADAILDRLPG